MKGPRSRGLVLSELLIFLVLCFILASGVLLRSSVKNSYHSLVHETERFTMWLTESMNEARLHEEVFDLSVVLVSDGNYMAVKSYITGYRKGTQETWYSDKINMTPDQKTSDAVFDGGEDSWSTAISFNFSRRRGNPMTKTVVVAPTGFMYLSE